MLYVKNVPRWERVLRVIVGGAGLGLAVWGWGVSGLAVGAGLAGAMLGLTGLVGFCPMCALAGRRLDRQR